MIEIIPAIIPKNFKDLERHLQSVAGLVPLVQVDVMDGKFTSEASWPYINSQEDPDFIAIKKEEREFPALEEIDFEVDLMVKNPENVWFDWIMAGAKRIIFHIESTEKIKELLEDAKQRLVSKESFLYVEVGLAIDINTPNDRIYPHLENIDFVQFMGIEKIGFQGQPFDERVLQKIKDFKNQYTKVQISVDGGVNLDTSPDLISAGANRLVSGSAIFKSNNIEDTIQKFKDLG